MTHRNRRTSQSSHSKPGKKKRRQRKDNIARYAKDEGGKWDR